MYPIICTIFICLCIVVNAQRLEPFDTFPVDTTAYAGLAPFKPNHGISANLGPFNTPDPYEIVDLKLHRGRYRQSLSTNRWIHRKPVCQQVYTNFQFNSDFNPENLLTRILPGIPNFAEDDLYADSYTGNRQLSGGICGTARNKRFLFYCPTAGSAYFNGYGRAFGYTATLISRSGGNLKIWSPNINSYWSDCQNANWWANFFATSGCTEIVALPGNSVLEHFSFETVPGFNPIQHGDKLRYLTRKNGGIITIF